MENILELADVEKPEKESQDPPDNQSTETDSLPDRYSQIRKEGLVVSMLVLLPMGRRSSSGEEIMKQLEVMKTKTVLYRLNNPWTAGTIWSAISEHENKGWAVRQIVQSDELIWVVYEDNR